MSEAGAPRRGAVPIGDVAEPPFVRLPNPEAHFRQRAHRFALLSEGHGRRAHLRFRWHTVRIKSTLELDLFVRERGYRRGGVNPFLLGY